MHTHLFAATMFVNEDSGLGLENPLIHHIFPYLVRAPCPGNALLSAERYFDCCLQGGNPGWEVEKYKAIPIYGRYLKEQYRHRLELASAGGIFLSMYVVVMLFRLGTEIKIWAVPIAAEKDEHAENACIQRLERKYGACVFSSAAVPLRRELYESDLHDKTVRGVNNLWLPCAR